MKAAVLKEMKIEIEEREIPQINSGEVLVKVGLCGICGSDLHAYTHVNYFPSGTIMGHEFAGIIEKVYENEKKWKVGQRIVVRPCGICGQCHWCKSGQISLCPTHMDSTLGLRPQGAYAEYVAVPTYMLYNLPEHITFEQAAQLEPVTVCIHALKISRFQMGDNVLIYGAGPIGITLYQLLNLAGANRIIIVEKSTMRREIARKLGAKEVLHPDELNVKKLSDSLERLGVDIVYDCAGVSATINQSFDIVRKGGQIVMLGITPEPVAINQFQWVVKGVEVIASMGYFMGDFEIALSLLNKGSIDVESLITDIISLDDIEEKGFKKLLSPDDAMKILVRP